MLNLSNVPEKRRAKAERWLGIISKQNQSGLSIDSFCRKEGVNPSTFYHWSNYLNGKIATPSSIIHKIKSKREVIKKKDSHKLIAIKVTQQQEPIVPVAKDSMLCALHLRNDYLLKIYDAQVLSILLKELS